MQKTILVTGGNRGIGKEICAQLAAQGHRVLLACRDITQGVTIASEMKGKVEAVTLDLSQSQSIEPQWQAIRSQYSPVDALVNNAAILREGNVQQLELEDFRQSLETNLTAPLVLCRLVLPDMLEQGYGRIVNLSSGWGAFSEGLEGPAAYSISKAALNAMTVSLANSLPETIKVNAACPGWVRTDMGGPDAYLSAEEGAKTPVWLATLDDDGPTGGFFREKRPIEW